MKRVIALALFGINALLPVSVQSQMNEHCACTIRPGGTCPYIRVSYQVPNGQTCCYMYATPGVPIQMGLYDCNNTYMGNVMYIDESLLEQCNVGCTA
ncbi:hypothetical protein GCM10027275_17640 [Rhabdobacter roseus]